MKICANYKVERKAFLSLIEPNCKNRIILFTGQSGIGKTRLIEACREDVGKSIYFLPIQLRGAAVGISEIFWRVGDCIDWDNLPEFEKKISELNKTIVNITGNKIIGINNQISVILQVEYREAREELQVALTSALFEDLRKLKRSLLIVIDTYEDGASEVKKWISGPFLARAANTKNIRVAIAGQEVPDCNSIDWGHCCEQPYKLDGVTKAEHWVPVVKALNLEVPEKPAKIFLAGICYAFNGHPMSIMNKITGFSKLKSSNSLKKMGKSLILNFKKLFDISGY